MLFEKFLCHISGLLYKGLPSPTIQTEYNSSSHFRFSYGFGPMSYLCRRQVSRISEFKAIIRTQLEYVVWVAGVLSARGHHEPQIGQQNIVSAHSSCLLPGFPHVVALIG